jgi:hypothetical protein
VAEAAAEVTTDVADSTKEDVVEDDIAPERLVLTTCSASFSERLDT